MSSQPPTSPHRGPGPRVRPHLPGGLGDILGGTSGTLDPDPPQPPVDPSLVTVAVFGAVAPSTDVRLLGHAHLGVGSSLMVLADPDLDAVLDAPARSWPVRVVVTWPVGTSRVVECIEVRAFGRNELTLAPGGTGPHWGIELATATTAPAPGVSGPGVPASLFCQMFPWAFFCN